MGSDKVGSIVDSIGGLTVLELSELVKTLEEKFGVTAAVAVAAPAAGGGAPGATEAPVVDEVDAVLSSAGDKKIQVLKVIREITGLGLKEAKDLVDGAPKPIKQKVKRVEAEEIKKKVEAEGGKVEIQ